jgi:hypothetical protein
MFGSSVERTIVGMAIVLWFAHVWYLSARLREVHLKFEEVHLKLDRVLANFEGLRNYLYEIDPQFDDERESNKAVFDDTALFAAMDDIELLKRKRDEGRRTLNTPFVAP